MKHFIWLDEYKIGEELIDQQHQYLFELANQIVDSDGIQEVRSNLMALFKYVREHFNAEEGIMKSCNYPGYKRHVAEHEKLLNRLLEISDSVGKEELNTNTVVELMTRWLLTHILQEDRQIGEFLNEKPLLE